MTARGINDALALLDVTVRWRALRYRHSWLLSAVGYNPVVYHPILECLRHGLKAVCLAIHFVQAHRILIGVFVGF